MRSDNKELKERNAALSSENEVLKQQVAYFQETFANSSLVGNIQQPTVQVPTNAISQDQLDQFKLEILQKLRFIENDDKEKSTKSLDSDEYQIQPENYDRADQDVLLDRKINRDPFEQLTA